LELGEDFGERDEEGFDDGLDEDWADLGDVGG